MSEHLTHLAVCDDARRLAVASPSVPAPLRAALRDNRRMCRYGSSCNWGGRHFVHPALERYRAEWPPAEGDLAMRTAFVLGRVTHNAADDFFKPVAEALGEPPGRSEDEAELYQDAVVLRRVFDGGTADPFAPGTFSAGLGDHPGSSAVDAGLAELYLGSLHQQGLLRRHREVASAAAGLSRPTTATTVDGLSPGRSYELTVTAVDGAGNESAPSPSVTATTAASTGGQPPRPPRDPTVGATTDPGVVVEWDPPTGGATVDHYVVAVDGRRHRTVATPGVTLDDHLADGDYEVTVTAVGPAGRESRSSPPVTVDPGDQSPYLGGSPLSVPGTVSFGAYDEGGQGVAYFDTTAVNRYGSGFREGTAVDISGGGRDLGWVAAGEWLEFTVDVETGGTYAVDVEVSSNVGGGAFRLESPRGDVTGPIGVADTGGWGAFTTLTAEGVPLSPGRQLLRLRAVSAGFNARGMTFRLVSSDTTAPRPPTDLAVTDADEASVALDWTPAADDGTGVARYVVAVDGERHHLVDARTAATVDRGVYAVLGALEEYYVDLPALVDALAAPEPAKQTDYIEDPGFYDGSDPAVAAARSLQRGETPDDVHAKATATQSSQYATVVADAYRRIERVGAYLDGDLTLDELREYTS